MNKNILVLISVLLMSSYIYASNITVSFPENITLVNNPVSVELYVYNGSNSSELITLTSYISPFPSSFSENQFRLSPNESKRVTVTISPLNDYLESVYSSSIEIKSANYYNKQTFNIIQKTNRICSIDLQYFVMYVPSSDEYKLELILKNNSIVNKDIEIIGLKDINLSDEIGIVEISGKTEVSTVRLFKTEERNVILEYRCNGLFGKKEIELPEKKTPIDIKTGFTGLFSFIGSVNLGNFWDSLLFQIILIIILIILVLSFSTRYIKYIYKR
jgi:hypothetical protein